jgi:dTDP-4-amino-4,6-dideoxygalactose transaminase
MNIPLVNLKAQYTSIEKEVDAAIKKVCSASDFILGHEVEAFEKSFAKYCGVKYCVGVANGTDAIKLMLLAAGIKPCDEIIVQANTFIASVLPIIELGANPVLVDADPITGAINPELVVKAITKKTRAILPVHLYGYPAPMKALMRIAKKHHLLILEDAAQAHGSSIQGKKAGSFGDIASFSFYPGKNLGAYGDGGAVVTNNKTYAESLQILRNIGQKKKYDHVRLGFNSRLDTIQAAVLSVKLKYLNVWNKKRNINAQTLVKELAGVSDIAVPALPSGDVKTNWHIFAIQTHKRDALMRYLQKHGIHTGIHYPAPLHLTPALKFLGYKKGAFPIAESRAKMLMTIPLYAELTQKEINFIIQTIKAFFIKTT